MDLELRNVQVKDVVLGDKNDLKDGVLTVDVEGLKKLILEDPRVTAVKVDLAKPGESCRILPVKDVVEPRYKPEGETFPGVFGSDVPEAGSGVTYVLKGCAVVTTGPIVGFQEGLIDMSGPAAQYTLFSKLNNVVLHLTKREDVDQHEHEEVVRMAGLKAARWLGEVAVKAESYDSEFYHWPTAAERANQYPDLPKVVYVCNCMAQGLLHDTYFYGRDAKQLVPTVVSPTEFFDGAIISGNCVSACDKNTTYHHQNNPVVADLFEQHGKTLNYVCNIITNENVYLADKQRSSDWSAKLCRLLDLDGAIISQEGFGNPDTDLIMNTKKIEQVGVKTTIITDEYAGQDGKSQSLADADPLADAVVTGGNANQVIVLPAMDKVIGTLDYVDKIAGGHAGSLREDGSIEAELQVITGATNEMGFNCLSAR